MSSVPNKSGKDKYRPYFSAEEMAELILLLKTYPSPKRQGMLQYLESFAIKIQHGLVAPSTRTQLSIMERLELVPEESSVEADKLLYNKWKLAPEKLSAPQIEKVMEFRYTNDLMTPKEEQEYEIAKGLV